MEFIKRIVTSIGKNDDHMPYKYQPCVLLGLFRETNSVSLCTYCAKLLQRYLYALDNEFRTICAQRNTVGLSEETKQNTRLIVLHYLVHSKSSSHVNSGIIKLEGLLDTVASNHSEINNIRYLHAVGSYRLGDLDRCLAILEQIPADLDDSVAAKVAVLKADAQELLNADVCSAGTVVVVAVVAVAGTILAARYGFPSSDFLLKEGPEEFKHAGILKDLIEKRIAKNVVEGVSEGVSALTYAALSMKAAFITQAM